MIPNGEALILLAATIHLDGVLAKLDKIQATPFDTSVQFEYEFVYNNIMRLWNKAEQSKISVPMLGASLTDELPTLSGDLVEWGDDIIELYEDISKMQPADISSVYVDGILDRIASDKLKESAKSLLDNIFREEGPSGIQAKLVEGMKTLADASTVHSAVAEDICSNPLLSLEAMMVASIVWPTGVDFFDELSGGGLGVSKLWGFLAPTGGGKTTFAIQTSMSWVKQGDTHNSVIFLYEQPPEGDIATRILSHTTGDSTAAFRNKKLSDLDPELVNNIRNNSSKYAKRLTTVDLSKPGRGIRGLEDIKSTLDKLGLLKRVADIDTEVEPPVYVLLDWLIPFLQREMTGDGAIAIGSDLRGYGTKVMDEIKAFKNEYNVNIVIFHQLNAESAAGSSARTPAWSDAAEWKGFAWMLDDCYAVGNRTDDDVAIMVATKVRTTARTKLFVKLDGAYCRFKDISNDYFISNGKVLPKNSKGMRNKAETPINSITNKLVSKVNQKTAASIKAGLA